MTKRIKKVFTNRDQVLHLWANQSQNDARCNNVFFEGDTCYSYGPHYKLGRIVDHNGVKVALVNDEGYSVTTSKHISSAARAASHLVVIYSHCLDIEDGLQRYLNELINRLISPFLELKFYNDENKCLISDISDHNTLCNILGFPQYKLDVAEDYLELIRNHKRYRIETNKINKAKKLDPEFIKKKQELKERKQKLEIDKWLNGGTRNNTIRSLRPQLIRVKNNEVETSSGASVPLKDALNLLNHYQN